MGQWVMTLTRETRSWCWVVQTAPLPDMDQFQVTPAGLALCLSAVTARCPPREARPPPPLEGPASPWPGSPSEGLHWAFRLVFVAIIMMTLFLKLPIF